MKRLLALSALAAALALTACVAYVEPTGYSEPAPGIVVAPVLPNVVILPDRPFYSYGGYVYYYDTGHDYWLYSRNRSGPWYRLPGSHYPNRFQYRGKWHGGGAERDRGWGGDRDRRMDRDRMH